jgi:hypothetical protein
MPSRHVVFVVPFFLPATLRFVAGATRLDGVRLSLVSQDPLERLPVALRERLAGHWRVDDALRASDLVGAVRELSRRHGPVERLIGSLEQLQVPLAEAARELGLPGLDPAVARRFRDKHVMKAAFAAAGIPCARNRLVEQPAAAREFIAHVGLPIVVKPPAGAGGRNTFRLSDPGQFESWLAGDPPRPGAPVLLEEFLRGEEYSFDSVTIDGRTLWSSISVYRPSPLTVLENPWIQWCVLLPRSIDGAEFAEIRALGPRAIATLGLHTGMTHMEWFRRPDGSVAISEVAARPPGAQFTTLISHAHETDFYAAWPRLVSFDEFTVGPRAYAVGAAYLRGLGEGRVVRVEGLQALRDEFGAHIVEARVPEPGEIQPPGYEGAGYIIFRHGETAVVESALRRTLQLVRLRLG